MIIELPIETLIHILQYLQYIDIVNLFSTCKDMRDIMIQHDKSLWSTLLFNHFNVIYHKTERMMGPRRMFYEAELSIPLRRSILIKHYNFRSCMPDYSHSYKYIQIISDLLDKSYNNLLLDLTTIYCKEVEDYFLQMNGPNNYIISTLTKNDKIDIRFSLMKSIVTKERLYSDFALISNNKLNKLVYMHKLSKFFISFTASIQKSIFLSCLYNLNKEVLQYFMDVQMLQTTPIHYYDLEFCFPSVTNNSHVVNDIIDMLEYLYRYNLPISEENFINLLLYNDDKILQSFYEKVVATSNSNVAESFTWLSKFLDDMDEALLLKLCMCYIKDRNIEKFNIVREELKLNLTGIILKVDGNLLDTTQSSQPTNISSGNVSPTQTSQTVALSLKKFYPGITIYGNIQKLYLKMIDLLFELLNNDDNDTIAFVKKLDLKDKDLIAILSFNTIFKFCDNIMLNHYDLLTQNPCVLNLVFPNCNKMVAASLLKFGNNKLMWKPPQNVINYCALNLSNIEILQSNGYYQDKITNDKMKSCYGKYNGYLLKRKWLIF